MWNINVILFQEHGETGMLHLKVKTKQFVKHCAYYEPIIKNDICVFIHRKMSGGYVISGWWNYGGSDYLIFAYLYFLNFLQ